MEKKLKPSRIMFKNLLLAWRKSTCWISWIKCIACYSMLSKMLRMPILNLIFPPSIEMYWFHVYQSRALATAPYLEFHFFLRYAEINYLKVVLFTQLLVIKYISSRDHSDKYIWIVPCLQYTLNPCQPCNTLTSHRMDPYRVHSRMLPLASKPAWQISSTTSCSWLF